MTEENEKYEVQVHKANEISMVERLASNPDVDVEKLERIVRMQEREIDREAKKQFNAAMTQAQAKIELVVAREKNTQTGSNYADLKAILLKAKPIYTAEGFSLMFYEGDSPKESQKRVCVDIMHEAGHTEKRHGDFTVQTTGIAGKAMMTQIHGEGSVFSYGRRYLTCMIFNIPTGDDNDGNASSGEPSKFEQWEVLCNEAGEAAQSVDEMKKWWTDNGPAVKKELKKPDAAKIYDIMVSHKKRLEAMRQPGED